MNMRSVCFCFQVHQPYKLRTYRFFEIGKRHQYYDDYFNRITMQRVAEHCYLPMNNLMLKKINQLGERFNFSISFSGIGLELMQMFAPQALESFKNLVSTSNVEVLSETYSHSISSLMNKQAFKMEVNEHKNLMKELFGVRPKTFHNTELIYSNEIGADVAEMGYKMMITDGAKHILGWKSPNYLYTNAINPKLKIMLRNYKLSDVIALKFGKEPVTVDDFIGWLNAIPADEDVVNIFLDYETFGEYKDASTGIFDFMDYLPDAILKYTDFQIVTPSQIMNQLQPLGVFDAPVPLSCRDEERDVSTWMGNDMQDDALASLYSCFKKVRSSKDPDLKRDWRCLQSAEYFASMCTKNPNGTPYDTYINYMNILTDFKTRI